MRALFLITDSVLRGQFTRSERDGADLPVRRLVFAAVTMGMIYGISMGLYGATRPGNASLLQLLASTAKVPLLFLLTLLITFPSLYVTSALARSRLDASATLRLLLVAITVNLALLASFGFITAFFTMSTTSYPFMVLLNVCFFAVAGLVGLHVLSRALNEVFDGPAGSSTGVTESDPDANERQSPRPVKAHDAARFVLRTWVVIYAVVGAQTGWILRPFIGDPRLEFTWFRARESNFLEAVCHALAELGR